MPSRRVAFLDVFAERPLSGNGVAVVDDADGVSDEVMLAFAKETRLSETTFVQSAEAEGAHYRNRIWTPGEELAFAGHPSLGTAVAVARWRNKSEASFVQETGSGLHPIEVREEGEAWRSSILLAETRFGPELDPAEAMRALGLEPGDAHPELAPQMASTGIFHALAPIADALALARIEPDYPAIDALIGPHEGVVLYPVSVDPDEGRARARGFSRIVELGEDPATGSAAGPLCAYLDRYAGCRAVTISQGEEMGRPSVLEAETAEGGRVRLNGSVRPLIEGTVELPG
ncbi:MAG: PhzF family phenazine biosynthesis protein [Actinomycetota bacterium]|nr:PhzF family phenazine biosynthesis protein [Actinomycetota bacterium]